jgi:hypothetical protein
VADEEPCHHADHDRDQGDAGEGRQFAVELLDRDRLRFRKRGLDEIVERPVPAVDGDADLDLKIRCEQDQRGTEDGPRRPGMRREHHPCAGEDYDAKGKIEVEPKRRCRPEYLHADATGRRRPDEIAGKAIPERHRHRRPDDGREKEHFRVGEK